MVVVAVVAAAVDLAVVYSARGTSKMKRRTMMKKMGHGSMRPGLEAHLAAVLVVDDSSIDV